MEALKKKCPSLSVNISAQKGKSFTGIETTIVAISFILTAVLGGILSSLGQDIWKRIKSLCERLTLDKSSKIQYEIRLTLEVDIDERKTMFHCRLGPESKLEKLDLFLVNVPQKVMFVASSIKKVTTDGTPLASIVQFEFLEDGRWLEERCEGKAKDDHDITFQG
jgi:hypothetical protein